MADCEFMSRTIQAGILVEICEVTKGICRVDPQTTDHKHCVRRQWKLDQLQAEAERTRRN